MKELLLLPRRHADALLPEGALQVPAGGVPLRAAGRGEPPPRRARDPEFELLDTGVFDGNRYFDVFAEYAKASPDDILIRLTVANRGPEPATLHLLPTLWFRNTWSWGRTGEGYWPRGRIARHDAASLVAQHASLGTFRLAIETPATASRAGAALHRERDATSSVCSACRTRRRTSRTPSTAIWSAGEPGAVNPAGTGTKAAAHFTLALPAGGEVVVRLRLFPEAEEPLTPFGPSFDDTFATRLAEADAFYASVVAPEANDAERLVSRQAVRRPALEQAVLSTTRRSDWLDGDPSQPPAAGRRARRAATRDWRHLYNRDVISMPDKWEYPWFAAWDLAFHMRPVRAPRSALRQGAARALPARVVHAPERADPGLRVRVRRREPAGARLGVPGASTR